MAPSSTRRSGLKLLPAHSARAAVVARRESAAIESELTAKAAETFIKQLGGRTAYGELLALAVENVDEEHAGPLDTLAALLLDPAFDRMSLADLCQQAGFTLRDLFRSYRSAALYRAHLLSTAKIAEKLPDVTEDVMRRAAPYESACEVCAGTGSAPGPTADAPPVPCEACKGRGRFMVDPELDRQKLALELGELLKRGGGGVSVTQQNLNVNAAGGASGGGAGSYERYQQALMHALATPLPPTAKIVDVTPKGGGEE